jgi:predicted ATPase
MADPGFFLREVRFRTDYRCFKRGRTLRLRPGVNLLVGDQGAGKSSLLNLVRDLSRDQFSAEQARETIEVDARRCRAWFFDFERDNLRLQTHLLPGEGTRAQIASMFMSHGETVNSIVGDLPRMVAESADPSLVLLDEPDMALSPRSVHKLARGLQAVADAGGQVVASAHSPILIASQEQVLSLEHKRWLRPQTFLAKHAAI